MDHNAFLSALKAGSLKTAYLFHGEEEFVKDRALERLLGTLDPAMREINVQDAPAQDAAAIRAACEALPFFADRRIVLVNTTDTGKEAEALHHRFHQDMIEHIAATMSDDEIESLTACLGRLSEFFFSLSK